jgi:hypothetical protein
MDLMVCSGMIAQSGDYKPAVTGNSPEVSRLLTTRARNSRRRRINQNVRASTRCWIDGSERTGWLGPRGSRRKETEGLQILWRRWAVNHRARKSVEQNSLAPDQRFELRFTYASFSGDQQNGKNG